MVYPSICRGGLTICCTYRVYNDIYLFISDYGVHKIYYKTERSPCIPGLDIAKRYTTNILKIITGHYLINIFFNKHYIYNISNAYLSYWKEHGCIRTHAYVQVHRSKKAYTTTRWFADINGWFLFQYEHIVICIPLTVL